jgi:hypothetical protein
MKRKSASFAYFFFISQQNNYGFCDIVSRIVSDVQACFCQLAYTVLYIMEYASALIVFIQMSYSAKRSHLAGRFTLFSLSLLYNPTYLVQHQKQNVRRLPYVVRIPNSPNTLSPTYQRQTLGRGLEAQSCGWLTLQKGRLVPVDTGALGNGKLTRMFMPGIDSMSS